MSVEVGARSRYLVFNLAPIERNCQPGVQLLQVLLLVWGERHGGQLQLVIRPNRDQPRHSPAQLTQQAASALQDHTCTSGPTTAYCWLRDPWFDIYKLLKHQSTRASFIRGPH